MTRRRANLIRAVAVGYAVLVVVASVLPSGGGAFGGWDEGISTPVQKAGHVASYALLVVLLAWAVRPAGPHTPRLLGLVAFGSMVLGLGLEWAQTVIPGRTGSVQDVLLNAAGAAAGVALTAALRPGRGRKAPAAPSEAPQA